MGATYDAINDRVLLTGDGTGWARMKKALPAPPAGTNQAIYVMRYWYDTLAANTSLQDSNLTWDTGFHLGFKFDAAHPAKPTVVGQAVAEADYTDFYGNSQFATVAGQLDDACISSEDPGGAVVQDYGVLAIASTGLDQLVSDGNGTTDAIRSILDPTKTVSEMPYSIPRNETIGLAATYVYRVFTDELNDAVHHEAWLNVGSIDLTTFNLQTDLDPDNPKAAIPTSNSWEDSLEINGAAEVGTNWRPSTGVMAFPTYFMARFPMISQQLVIDYLGIQYSELAVV